MKLDCKFYIFNVVLLLLSFFRSSESSSLAFISNVKAVNACAIVDCAMGTCRTDDNSLLGFECDCYSGWKKLQIPLLLNITLPPCIIPDCTLDFSCGTPPPPSIPPAFNLSSPCTFTWCGDGNCTSNGTGYECDCNAGSDNLLNKKSLPCFQECSLGADCHDLGIGKNTSPPPQSNSSPPSKPSSSYGLREFRTASIIKDSLTVLILAAVLLPWL